MALAARPMYAKNLLPGNLGVAAAPGALPQPPPAGALTDIENFSLMIAILMPQVTAADHGINFDSTQNLLELLAWLSGVVFPNALARYPAADQGQAAWINANNAANNLGLLTNSTAALGPYVLNGAAANAPAETPLELVYETVLQGLPAVNFAAGWAALNNVLLPGNLNARRGMPRIGMLCFGQTAAPAPVPRLVATANIPDFQGLRALGTWTLRARRDTIPVGYRGQVTNLSDRLVQRGGLDAAHPAQAANQDVLAAWNNALAHVPPGNPDAAIAAAWVNNCAAAPAIGPPITFPRLQVVQALGFNTHNRVARSRCRRCRVLYPFTMAAGEPQVFVGGPYQERISCAEVVAYTKCARFGI